MVSASHLGAGHPEEDVLERYVMGKLDVPALETIEDHLLICAPCQERVETTEMYIRSLRSALASAPHSNTRDAWRDRISGWFQMPAPVWAGAAAVLVLGLAGLTGSRYFASSGAPVAVALTATRGETASIAAKGPLDLDLDARDLAPTSSYRVQMVNAEGKTVWEQLSAPVSSGHVPVRVTKRLPPGQYFVRIFGADVNIPREYAIQIR